MVMMMVLVLVLVLVMVLVMGGGWHVVVRVCTGTYNVFTVT